MIPNELHQIILNYLDDSTKHQLYRSSSHPRSLSPITIISNNGNSYKSYTLYAYLKNPTHDTFHLIGLNTIYPRSLTTLTTWNTPLISIKNLIIFNTNISLSHLTTLKSLVVIGRNIIITSLPQLIGLKIKGTIKQICDLPLSLKRINSNDEITKLNEGIEKVRIPNPIPFPISVINIEIIDVLTYEFNYPPNLKKLYISPITDIILPDSLETLIIENSIYELQFPPNLKNLIFNNLSNYNFPLITLPDLNTLILPDKFDNDIVFPQSLTKLRSLTHKPLIYCLITNEATIINGKITKLKTTSNTFPDTLVQLTAIITSKTHLIIPKSLRYLKIIMTGNYPFTISPCKLLYYKGPERGLVNVQARWINITPQ